MPRLRQPALIRRRGYIAVSGMWQIMARSRRDSALLRAFLLLGRSAGDRGRRFPPARVGDRVACRGPEPFLRGPRYADLADGLAARFLVAALSTRPEHGGPRRRLRLWRHHAFPGARSGPSVLLGSDPGAY